jgi:hypothetical protein
MTSDDLRAWMNARQLRHQAAADLLALPVATLRSQLYHANRPIGAQTERIIELLDDRTHALQAMERFHAE